MGKYVDGFVLIIPKDKTEDYKKMAVLGRDSWMKHGALEYFECRADDLTPQAGNGESSRDFADMTGATTTENVWFSFIIFESKEHRNEVNAKVMAEMETQMAEYSAIPMPFQMSRMAYAGFQVEVEGSKLV